MTSEPLSTLFYLPPNPNVTYSASLMSKAEETFRTGKSPSPIERTLLTTGLVEAGVRSLGTGQQRIKTPHLAVRYQVPRESTFARSWRRRVRLDAPLQFILGWRGSIGRCVETRVAAVACNRGGEATGGPGSKGGGSFHTQCLLPLRSPVCK
jgi:hypothetical protein